jgi:glycosyltransferase involved in cell wall biosynthesis/SAM-dependent methyltransferase
MGKTLTQANLSDCQKKFNLSYHVPFAYLCQQLVGFEGKDVIEVGGSLPRDFVFDYLNVKSWTAIETPEYEVALQEAGGLSHKGTILDRDNDHSSYIGFAEPNLHDYNFFLANIEDLPHEHHQQYDLIFSIAAFEHIHKLPLALRKMFLALKPSGKLFSLFSPIWSAYNGHHLPKITDKQGNRFDFSNSPIPPWGHLLFRPQELYEYLCQFMDRETAEIAVYYVYNSNHINRFFTEDYIEFVKKSPFTIERLEGTFSSQVPPDTQAKLCRLYPGRTQFNNNGLLALLSKPLNNQESSPKEVNSYLNSKNSVSGLDRLIPPDIKNDEFYNIIQKIAREETIQTILEIGSSSGEGSTEAFVTGIRANPNQPTLFCIEVSKPRFTELQRQYAEDTFVKCYNVSSVPLERFPEEKEVVEFYENHRTVDHGLGIYPLEQVLSWLHQNIDYVKDSGVPERGIALIKQENNIDNFDVVLIDGSQFTGSAELDEVYGAKFILLDDINTFKNHENYHRLKSDSNYLIVTENKLIRHGYAVFRKIDSTVLPVHFFTIVLNGEPFIRHHIEVFKQLPFKWHWHIVEGVADLKHDTAWVLRYGGRIIDEMHHDGRSKDGTTEYLDELAREYPDRVTVYRKPEGVFWDGKREMISAPLANIHEECLLWQVDADELWTSEQICKTRQLFIRNPEKTAAFYWCWYFVGENLVISTRNCYAQNPKQEWLRTWRYKPGAVWASHSPPKLVEPLPNGEWRNIAAVNPFLHEETEKEGIVFQHFAYATPEQLEFKEHYYGYENAVSSWTALQEQKKFPVRLRQYFPWVRDLTLVDTAESRGVAPIAQKQQAGERESWRFLKPEEIQQKSRKIEPPVPKILVDGVFFQFYKTGIARVWRSLLEEWVETGFAKHIVVLDRAGTAPEIPGIESRLVPPYDYSRTDADREMLQQVCDREGADLFISTYYTTPLSTPSAFMAYDMIPEVVGADFTEPMWREKHHGLQQASAYITISENTARDLVRFFPDIDPESVTVAHCGVKNTFSPASSEEIDRFKTRYGIAKPYFILVGLGVGYKNAILFFQAFSKLFSKQGFELVGTGSGGLLDPQLRTYTSGVAIHMLQLSDEELRAAYSGAVGLVYPSKYEGFGLPVLEAMACGCPVITCPNASIPEVAGKAALYVKDDDVEGLAEALCDVQKPNVRQALITAGLEQAKKFSWAKMAKTVSSALVDATLQPLNLKEINPIVFPDWSRDEESLGADLERVIREIATHPDKHQITLLIDTTGISEDDASLLVSGVAMNLLMQEDLDVSEGPEISLIGKLGEIQWQALLPRLQARIVLERENKEAIAAVNAESIPACELDSLSRKRAVQQETGNWVLQTPESQSESAS